MRAGLAAGAVVASLALILAASRSCRSAGDRLADAIDAARDDFDAGRDAEFLARFADALVYRGGRGKDALAADLAAWRKAGISGVRITGSEIRAAEATGTFPASGTAELTVDVGPVLHPLGRVTVRIAAEERSEGFVVTSFDWK
ncbi:MAG: hypothetical protein HMLKMBBP_01722 [Planctomycetes bacterium]|nr:hypothetical protein [Planctomycetota bacterium]